MHRNIQLMKQRSLQYQRLFLRTNWVRRWVLIVGEGIAVISGCAYFIPGLPHPVHEIALPVAVLSGAIALLSVAIYDKFDPTVIRSCLLSQDAYDSLSERGLVQQDVMYFTREELSPTQRRPSANR